MTGLVSCSDSSFEETLVIKPPFPSLLQTLPHPSRCPCSQPNSSRPAQFAPASRSVPATADHTSRLTCPTISGSKSCHIACPEVFRSHLRFTRTSSSWVPSRGPCVRDARPLFAPSGGGRPGRTLAPSLRARGGPVLDKRRSRCHQRARGSRGAGGTLRSRRGRQGHRGALAPLGRQGHCR